MKRTCVLVAALCFVLIRSTAYACSCGTGDPPFEFNRAKTVFIGQMLGGTEQVSVLGEGGKSRTIEAGQVRFAVEEVFKGSVPNEATIEIDSMKGTSCGPYGLERGERYIVYAYSPEKDGENLHTGVCTRTAPVHRGSAREDIEFLRNLPQAGTGGNLSGRIWADLRAGGATPLSDVRVDIRSAGEQVITVTTDNQGAFEVNKLKPGKYRVEPRFPPDYASDREFAEVTVDDLGTASVGFEAYINGRVSGRVLDKDGRGFNAAFLRLVGEGKSVYGHSVGLNGGFETPGIPPGEYVLYIEMQSGDHKKNMDFYYPGTFKREDAGLIKVRLGERVEGLEFHLPDQFSVRDIEGHVEWEDGKPAARVQVMLLCPRSANPNGFVVEIGPTTTSTDEQGRFRLEGLTGEVYWIEARGSKKGARKDEIAQVHSPSKELVLNENLKNSRLVLSEKGFSRKCRR